MKTHSRPLHEPPVEDTKPRKWSVTYRSPHFGHYEFQVSSWTAFPAEVIGLSKRGLEAELTSHRECRDHPSSSSLYGEFRIWCLVVQFTTCLRVKYAYPYILCSTTYPYPYKLYQYEESS